MRVLGLVDVPWWGILLLVIIGYMVYSCRKFNFFRKQGIPGQMPIPILGTAYTLFSECMAYGDLKLMKKYGKKGYCGGFFGTEPSLMVFDSAMLSKIMVKEFPSFSNRFVIKSNDVINESMILSLEDEHWKHVRSEMTPTFSTGKLKKMNSEMNRCAQSLANHLFELAKLNEDVEVKEYCGAYTMDVIASTAFGIQVDSQKDHNSPFVRNAKKAFEFKPANPRLFILIFLPELASLVMKLGVTFNVVEKDIEDFFRGITQQSIEMRKSDDDRSRTDFLQLMMNAEKEEDDSEEAKATHEGDKSHRMGITHDELLANAMLFFVAGYDTTSSSLAHLLYNMALCPEYQEKLVEEIRRVVGNKEFIDYSVLQEMPYLEKCINENLRMYPSLIRVNRKVTKDVTLDGVFFKKDCLIDIPIYAIHHDPKKWPEPETFDPERFSAENKKNRHPFDYIPFGNGPRNCIGMRLALQQLKVAAISVLRRIKVSKCDKTQVPLHFANNGFLLKADHGIWLKLSPREE